MSGLAAGVGVSLAAIATPTAATTPDNDDSAGGGGGGGRVVNGGGPVLDPVSDHQACQLRLGSVWVGSSYEKLPSTLTQTEPIGQQVTSSGQLEFWDPKVIKKAEFGQE